MNPGAQYHTRPMKTIYMDGQVCQFADFEMFASAVLDQRVEIPQMPTPPWSISRLCMAAHLTKKDYRLIRGTTHEKRGGGLAWIKDFWIRKMQPLPYDGDRDQILLVAVRFPTRGRGPMNQTLRWLAREGWENPIVSYEEDKWND